MKLAFEVDNIKCGGCVRSIERALKEVPEVSAVAVEVDAGRVTVSAPEAARELLREALLRLGYPERGSASGMAAVGAKAKSFVSCAIGRLSD